MNRRTSVGIVDGDVANGKLLVTDPHAEVASVEGEVAHEATRTVLHPDTLMFGVVTVGHLEAHVSERRSPIARVSKSAGNLKDETHCATCQ